MRSPCQRCSDSTNSDPPSNKSSTQDPLGGPLVVSGRLGSPGPPRQRPCCRCAPGEHSGQLLRGRERRAPSLVRGDQALPRDREESPRRTYARETVVWQNGLFSGNLPLSLQWPLSLHLAMEKAQPCPQQGRDKSQSLEFLLHIRAQSFGACTVCRGPS